MNPFGQEAGSLEGLLASRAGVVKSATKSVWWSLM